MIKNEDEAVKALAEVKGYLDTVAVEAKQHPVIINIMLSKLSDVQLFINPKINLNEIQDEVNKSHT